MEDTKKIIHICREIPALEVDKEGHLRGGFVGISGGEEEIKPSNPGCRNVPCLNKKCKNTSCTNGGCQNPSCDNSGCIGVPVVPGKPTPTPTPTPGKPPVSVSFLF